ncbi:hypothetical protein SJU70_15750 [Aeromonas caviae]|uniref:hypothetical protein n=1 Tax=Aeromonas caviae TaxID=648 RepID=UPI0029D96B4B|nr:hypothetical protein [Aeromonas caviae]MDX7892691.1 hypothetical protein [Aeromonas caviae]
MIEDIRGVVISRMNNVLMGGFIISAIMMNSRGILIFIYSDKLGKINILKNWEINVANDIMIPLALTFIYVTAIPLISSLFKKHIANKIYEKEHDAELDRLLISHRDMSQVSIAAAESTMENADFIVKSRVREWLNEKENTLSELSECKKHIDIITAEFTERMKDRDELNERSTYYASLYERMSLLINSLQPITNELLYPSQHLQNMLANAPTEYNKYIVTQFIKGIKNLAENVNRAPLNTAIKWHPPVDEAWISALSEYINKQAESGEKISTGNRL